MLKEILNTTQKRGVTMRITETMPRYGYKEINDELIDELTNSICSQISYIIRIKSHEHAEILLHDLRDWCEERLIKFQNKDASGKQVMHYVSLCQLLDEEIKYITTNFEVSNEIAML